MKVSAAARRTWTAAEKRAAALVLPLVTYDVGLRTMLLVERFQSIAINAGQLGTLDWLSLLSSPLLYHLGLAMACVGLLLAFDRRRGWPAVLLLAQALALFTLLEETAAYVFYLQNSQALQYAHVTYWLSRPGDLRLILRLVEPAGWAGLLLPALVVAVGPWVAPRLSASREEPLPQPPARSLATAALGLPVALIGLFPLTGAAADHSVVRDPVLELLASSQEEEQRPVKPVGFELEVERAREAPPVNVVIVLLESTRARSVAPWNPEALTPFLAGLARQSLVVERAYTVIPHTTKALIAGLCGIEPAHALRQFAQRFGMLEYCLPSLIAPLGYRSVFLQSADPRFEDRAATTASMGFEELVVPGPGDVKGFERANFLGYEDDALLEPSRRWLAGHRDKPFFAVYLTVAPHHEVAPLHRHGFLHLDDNAEVNRYENAVRADDFFLQALFEQYRELGLYRDTLFVLLGDHGEAFGEHGRYAHDGVPWEEALRIPLLFHDPGKKLLAPGVIPGPVSALDLVPTLLELLGLRVKKGRLAGTSMLHRPAGLPIQSACFGERVCLVQLRGARKLIHFFGARPDEEYDLASDPEERENLAADDLQRDAALKELLRWDQHVASLYWGEGGTARR